MIYMIEIASVFLFTSSFSSVPTKNLFCQRSLVAWRLSGSSKEQKLNRLTIILVESIL